VGGTGGDKADHSFGKLSETLLDKEKPAYCIIERGQKDTGVAEMSKGGGGPPSHNTMGGGGGRKKGGGEKTLVTRGIKNTKQGGKRLGEGGEKEDFEKASRGPELMNPLSFKNFVERSKGKSMLKKKKPTIIYIIRV